MAAPALPTANNNGSYDLGYEQLRQIQHVGNVLEDLVDATQGGAIGSVDIPLTSFILTASNAVPNTAANGGVLASDTVPILARVNGATDPALRMTWAENATEIPVTASIPIPADLDPERDAKIEVIGHLVDDSDEAVNMAVGAYFGVGDTNAGGNTDDWAQDTPAVRSVTIDAADIPDAVATGFLTIVLTPEETEDTTYHVYGVRLRYHKKVVLDL